ncbi:hypothetical protein KA005_75835, partial [bacterium]|nr:hypothetical protein [bacterium]
KYDFFYKLITDFADYYGLKAAEDKRRTPLIYRTPLILPDFSGSHDILLEKNYSVIGRIVQ